MKVILSIIFMFLSAQSFADLEGKALICKWKELMTGLTFEKNYKYIQYYVTQHNDTFTMGSSPLENYSVNSDYITIYMGLKINRKTLRRETSEGFDAGQCELAYYETIRDRMVEHKNERQKKYIKKLEGNKI